MAKGAREKIKLESTAGTGLYFGAVLIHSLYTFDAIKKATWTNCRGGFFDEYTEKSGEVIRPWLRAASKKTR